MSSISGALLARLGALRKVLFPENNNEMQDLEFCSKHLAALKLRLAELNLFIPRSNASKEELEFARDVLECACVLAVLRRDMGAFERSMIQVKSFYYSKQGTLSPSPFQNVIIGLNLLQLLANGKVAEFHTELEPLGAQACSSDPLIRFPVELEQSLVEGAFARLWQARLAAPHPLYLVFMDTMIGAVRDEVAACFELSYESLPVAEVQARLMLSSPEEVKSFCLDNRWTVSADGASVLFPNPNPRPPLAIPSHRIIESTVAYARELEKII